jgi:hypothetical protein
MSFFMSLVLTLINAGFGPSFWQRWMVAFGVSFVVGLPIGLVVIPLIKKVVDSLTAD